MTSQSKLPPGPVGIELLLELLNASEGQAASGQSPADVPDAAEEPHNLPPAATMAEPAEAVDVTAKVATPVEPIDDVENRYAAHIVRGMSKSKTG
jgi:hypothetical protein